MSRRLARNTAIGIAGTVALKGLSFASTQVLTRGLDQASFGTYSFVGVYLFFAGFFVDLGMELVLRRELSARPAHAPLMLGNAILLKLMLVAVIFPIAVAGAWCVGLDAQVRWCILIAALGLPLSTEGLFRAVLQSRYALATSLAVSVTSALTLLVFNLICVSLGWPLEWIFAAALINGVATVAAAWILARRYVRPHFKLHWDVLRIFFRESANLGVFAFLFMLAMRVDQIVLYRMRDAAELGRYAVAVRVTEALFVIPEALMLTWFPMMAASLHAAPERFHELCRLGAKCLASLVFPIALLFSFAAPALLTLIFGARYAGSAAPTAVLAWGMYFAYMGAIFINAFVIQSLQRLLLVVSALVGVLNVVLNVVLIHSYGATGSALAMLLANLAGFALWFAFPLTRPTVRICLSESLRPAVSATIASGAVWLLEMQGITAALLSVTLYAAVLGSIGGIDRRDLARARALADDATAAQ